MSLSGTYTTHRFDWWSSGVSFASFHGFRNDDAGTPIATWDFSPGDTANLVPHAAEPTHLNLWLFQGQPPENDAGVEIILHDFQHP
jgi:hypothetical protein